jgi:hypothetical protein
MRDKAVSHLVELPDIIIVIAGPVAATGKKLQPNPTATSSNLTSIAVVGLRVMCTTSFLCIT